MEEKKFNQAEYQNDWSKKNMAFVTAKYKKEFVAEFKEACKLLGTTQSQLLKETMTEVINQAIAEAKHKSTVLYTLYRTVNGQLIENNFDAYLTLNAAKCAMKSFTLKDNEYIELWLEVNEERKELLETKHD